MNQYQRLIDNLTKLNLNNMAESIADYRQQVNDSQISFSEALLELTDKEIDYQRQESLKRRIKRARFPIVKRLSDFNYQFQPSVNRQQIDEFLRPCHFWIIKRTLSLLAVLAWAKHTCPSDLASKHAGKACEHYS